MVKTYKNTALPELNEEDMPMIWMRDITCLFQLYLNT